MNDSNSIGSARKPSLDVHIHAHYRSELEHLLAKSASLERYGPYEVRLLVYTTEALMDPRLQDLAPRATFVSGSSKGRNFGSLIQARLDGYLDADYVVHVHTKRSPHLPFSLGKVWFSHLASSIFAQATCQNDTLFYFPRLEFLFSARSRKLWNPNGSVG